MRRKKTSGQSLLEMIVTLGIVILVILDLVVVTTISVRNASFSRNQALATKYAQKAIEKIRLFREEETWENFVGECETFDLGFTPVGFSISRDCHLPDTLSRCDEQSDICEVKVSVSWTDARGIHKSELTTRLTKKK